MMSFRMASKCLRLLSRSTSTPSVTRSTTIPIFQVPMSTASSGAEEKLAQTLQSHFPQATDINVVDVSCSSCGAKFEVFVESPEFSGIRVLKQHQMVVEALKKEIREMHGIRISTAVSKSKESFAK